VSLRLLPCVAAAAAAAAGTAVAACVVFHEGGLRFGSPFVYVLFCLWYTIFFFFFCHVLSFLIITIKKKKYACSDDFVAIVADRRYMYGDQ
jgi:hypothetical protein